MLFTKIHKTHKPTKKYSHKYRNMGLWVLVVIANTKCIKKRIYAGAYLVQIHGLFD
jgi:hypothetical protein